MSASVNDYFQKLGGASSLVNTPKVTVTRSAAGTTLTVDNCNWDQTTGKRFATFQVDTSGNVVDGTEIIWKGVVTSTTSIGSLARVAGASDTGNAIGDYVMLLPASDWGNQIVAGLLQQHAQDGTHTNITATGLTVTGTTQHNGTYTGWVGANETWSYSSYDSTNKTGVITVPTDATTKYTAGMRVMFTNNSATQYGIVTKVASTALTVYFGTDYSLTNSAITSPYYSSTKAPFGFPLDPAKWTVRTTDTADRTQASPTANTWYNPGSLSVSVPVGAWRLGYQALIYMQPNAAAASPFMTLSTANNTESDGDFSSRGGYISSSGSKTISLNNRSKSISVTSATSYYLNVKTDVSSTTSITVMGSGGTTVIEAVCAYL